MDKQEMIALMAAAIYPHIRTGTSSEARCKAVREAALLWQQVRVEVKA